MVKINNVLSLFDGISAGQLALKRANVEFSNYYASEIDKYAISVTQRHFPNTVQIGDVQNINFDNLLGIDLLMGGSPCQGFSIAGKRLNFEDPRSKLFFNYLDAKNRLNPKYFLLENVIVQRDVMELISELLGCYPIKINSSLVSAQSRNRYYWTNIDVKKMPIDKGILFKDILEKNREFFPIGNWAYSEWAGKTKINGLKTIEDNKSNTLTTNRTHSRNYYLNSSRSLMTLLSPQEAEILQTFPIGYTDNLTKTRRFHALGNSWTVDVIAHIFSHIK